MNRPLVSVVVIGRNEGARLERCLKSVNSMIPPGGAVEVVYVDSASSDGSPALAEALGARVVVIQPKSPTAAGGRNAGWRSASGEFILFLDGDTILDPRFVVDALRDFGPQTAAVFGHRREIRPQDSFFNRVLDLDWISPVGLADYCGGDALIRRAALEQVDGYDETLIAGEEPEMCRRMRARGWTILHVDRPMTGHDLAMTRWNQYWRRAVRTGYAYAEVSARFRNTNLPFWDVEARHNRSRAQMWIGIGAVAVVASAALLSAWPIVAAVAMFGALSARSAWKCRWKSKDAITLALYGVHSHIQQIPIFLGQRRYDRDRRAGKRAGLIEYKGPAQ
jgi:glycosyltransferase involved in cell wall biosynthesis